MEIYGVEEKRGTNYMAYTLIEQGLFYEPGYKVARTQYKKGFITCNYLNFNGYVRIVFNIEEKKTLSSVIKSISPNAFATIILNIIDFILDIKGYGFINIESVDFQPENIYVDMFKLKPYFIYLPIKMQSTVDSYQAMENYFRESMIYLIKVNDNLQGKIGDGLIRELSNQFNSIEQIRENISNLLGLDSIEEDNAYKVEEQDKTEKEHITMSEKLRKMKIERKRRNKSSQEIVGTTVLVEYFNPQIRILSVNPKYKVELLVDKKEYVIGHKKELVDGYIDNSSVSRTHCKIVNKWNKNYLVDLNSANGTWINGKKIKSNIEIEIRPGDKIKLSNCEFVVTAMHKTGGNDNG